MSAKQIVPLHKECHPAKSFHCSRIQDQHNAVIEACCDQLPAGMGMEDKLLFISMLNAILNVPTERCYKYAQA